MYSHVMPMPNDKSDEDKPLYDDRLDANNPDNFNKFSDFDDEEIVRA